MVNSYVKVQNSADYFCNVCIDILTAIGNAVGLSYGEVNILIFVILGPLASAFFMVSAIFGFVMPKPRIKAIRIISFALGCICLLLIFALVSIGLLEALITIKSEEAASGIP